MVWLMWVLVVVAVFSGLLGWAAFTRCTLHTFRATTGMHSRMSGPGAHDALVAALVRLPGVRMLERSGTDVLLSVLPVPAALDRGWGLYVLVRPIDDDVLLLARRRVPLPGGDLASALRELERMARQPGATEPSPFADS